MGDAHFLTVGKSVVVRVVVERRDRGRQGRSVLPEHGRDSARRNWLESTAGDRKTAEEGDLLSVRQPVAVRVGIAEVCLTGQGGLRQRVADVARHAGPVAVPALEPVLQSVVVRVVVVDERAPGCDLDVVPQAVAVRLLHQWVRVVSDVREPPGFGLSDRGEALSAVDHRVAVGVGHAEVRVGQALLVAVGDPVVVAVRIIWVGAPGPSVVPARFFELVPVAHPVAVGVPLVVVRVGDILLEDIGESVVVKVGVHRHDGDVEEDARARDDGLGDVAVGNRNARLDDDPARDDPVRNDVKDESCCVKAELHRLQRDLTRVQVEDHLSDVLAAGAATVVALGAVRTVAQIVGELVVPLDVHGARRSEVGPVSRPELHRHVDERRRGVEVARAGERSAGKACARVLVRLEQMDVPLEDRVGPRIARVLLHGSCIRHAGWCAGTGDRGDRWAPLDGLAKPAPARSVDPVIRRVVGVDCVDAGMAVKSETRVGERS